MTRILNPLRVAALLGTVLLPLVTAVCADKPAAALAASRGPAPDSFRVVFQTSRGAVTVQVNRAWAPKGADRFHDLVAEHFFDGQKFFRVIPGFIAQFGLNDKPAVNARWDVLPLKDDSVTHTNARGTVVFATLGPNTRTHQLFINLADNGRLDALGFAPIGRVVDGMEAVDSLFNGYGESPDQELIQTLGNSYLERTFPKLDFIRTATIP